MAKNETPEQAKLRREADAARKRRERKPAAIQKEIASCETAEQFWAANIKTADPAKLAAWQQRHERVLDLMWFIQEHVRGTYDASPERDATLPEDKAEYLSVEDGHEDLMADIRERGTVDAIAVVRQGQF